VQHVVRDDNCTLPLLDDGVPVLDNNTAAGNFGGFDVVENSEGLAVVGEGLVVLPLLACLAARSLSSRDPSRLHAVAAEAVDGSAPAGRRILTSLTYWMPLSAKWCSATYSFLSSALSNNLSDVFVVVVCHMALSNPRRYSLRQEFQTWQRAVESPARRTGKYLQDHGASRPTPAS
jgi:hypothetical protein